MVIQYCFVRIFPIVLAVEIWGEQLRNKKIRFHCDSMVVVQVINKQSASSPPVIRLLQYLVLAGLH